MNTIGTLIETLANSQTFRDYERAYTGVTGSPVALRPVETWQLPLHGKRNENPFCALMASRSRTCATCLQMQEKLCQEAKSGPTTETCTYGLCEAAVPVRLGDDVIGFLQTGQVFRQKPSAAQFERAAKSLVEQGVTEKRSRLKRAYFQTPVVSPKKFGASLALLGTFAEHLSMKSNQIAMQQANAEPPVITRAKQFIHEHQTEHLSLGQVARAVHTSTFYFCKLFKKAAGLNFTEYLSRARIEKARNLLLNPNLRISEIAYDVGFQSLTHFNRVFKKLAGQSPTEYRAQLART